MGKYDDTIRLACAVIAGAIAFSAVAYVFLNIGKFLPWFS